MVVSPRSVVVLVAGDPVPQTLATRGSYVELIRAAAPGFSGGWVSYDLRELDVLPELTGALGVIVTGSVASVTEAAPWMLRASECIRTLVRSEVPLLGICFGHQLMAAALGGKVARNVRGREMGTVSFTSLEDDPVLGVKGTWPVSSSHVDSVVELPSAASCLGVTELEPRAAVRFGPCAWGVQFHPEIDDGVMRQFLETRSDTLRAEGFDPSALLANVRATPEAARVIERFVNLAAAARS